MVKFNENELTKILKDFDDKSKIELGFEKGIEGKFEVEDASIGYDYKNGFIFIKGSLIVYIIFVLSQNRDEILLAKYL